ncbi:hypothetical protein Pmani_010810 [Petrolisthes manimaculis]|uniref:Reverse transcriptase domain-containing protein n=1 Tax=Petrolisthes manimaculis TaxID=1843537 RepID=A0AAE1UBM5_9EUCA|nr:hypothetical protein Pmani_010810 [Petrolisthes manimaculis]
MTGTKSASGDIITDRSKQMERWAEHYQELYTRENTITNAAIGSIDPHPVMEELDVPPSVEELSKAIDSLTCGRAPGSDGIPPEVLKSVGGRCIPLYTRSDGNLFNLASLRAKTKIREVLIREMLFADYAALTAHTEEALQRLVNSFAQACEEFGLTISLKKTDIMGQDVNSTPSISIGDHTLEVVTKFTYLGSTISSNLSLDVELNTRIGKAATAMARLASRVWDNSKRGKLQQARRAFEKKRGKKR